VSAFDPTAHLRALANRVADVYVTTLDVRAVLLVGSAATGDADGFSDLDLIVYHGVVPPDEAVAEASHELGIEAYRGIPWSDESREADERGLGERFHLDGVECQLAHMSVGGFEREIARVVVDLELSEELLKVLSGLFEGLPLHGHELIEDWRRRAGYTEPLQRATIEKRWKFFPWWYFQERLRTRDATAWRHEVLAQSVYGIVGTLAALNRVYFSTLEFKRARRFVSEFEIAPPELGARLDALFELDERSATSELERLVAETQALVAARFPDLDLSLEWGGKPTGPGERESSWASLDHA
jgi:hypothetical protein